MVSNLARAANSGFGSIGNSAGFNSEQGVQVTTGRHPAGYTVSAVRARPHFIHGTGNTPSLKIHSDDNGKPGALLHTLTNHSNLAVGSTLEFTASPAITFQPRTKYWLMFANDANIHNNFFLLKSSSSLDEEPCGELDWSIGNGRYLRRNGTLFTSSLAPLAVAVVGSQVDDGSASELECTDTAAATTTYTKIGMGATVIGAQQGDRYSNDEDWYQVTLEAGVKYQFDTFTSIFGLGLFGLRRLHLRNLRFHRDRSDRFRDRDAKRWTVRIMIRIAEGAISLRRQAGAYYLAVEPGPHGGPSGSVESAQDVPTYGVRVREADDYARHNQHHRHGHRRRFGGRGHFFAPAQSGPHDPARRDAAAFHRHGLDPRRADRRHALPVHAHRARSYGQHPGGRSRTSTTPAAQRVASGANASRYNVDGLLLVHALPTTATTTSP